VKIYKHELLLATVYKPETLAEAVMLLVSIPEVIGFYGLYSGGDQFEFQTETDFRG
jgi:hypothetical protein